MLNGIKKFICKWRDKIEKKLPIYLLTMNGKIRRLALIETEKEKVENKVKEVDKYFKSKRDNAWEVISQSNNNSSEFIEKTN